MNPFVKVMIPVMTWAMCIVCTSSAMSQKITFDLSVDQDILKPGNSDILLEYTLQNVSQETFSQVDFASELYVWRTAELDADLSQDMKSYDPNANGLLEPGEIWTFSVLHSVFVNIAETLVLNGGVRVQSEQGETHTAGDAEMIHVYGVNMDVDILNECVGPGDKMDITLTTRLLIDEDAAKNPGTTTIIVGGIEIEIQLPASQWEARDLIITATGLNDGMVFDPFSPPAGVMLTNFCEQGGVDAGRNTNNILDECEPIETVRAPCTMMGEDDVLCEFADWAFCYCIEAPTDPVEFQDFTVDFASIDATDEFTIWKADENPAGSGMYGEFIDVTDQVESGGSDSDNPIYKVIPVELVDFSVKKDRHAVEVAWATEAEINNHYFEVLRSNDGEHFESIGKMQGGGTTQSRLEYTFMDENPSLGLNYYKLMQVDFDGGIMYSSVRQIDLRYNSGSAKIEIQPNPVSDFLYIESQDFIGSVAISIYDEKGSIVKETKLEQGVVLDLTDLANGLYIVKVYDIYNYEIGTSRILVAR